MNAIKKMQETRCQAQKEFEKLGFVFNPPVCTEELNHMSVSELRDMGQLQIGESTYLSDIGDVIRVA